MSKKSGISQALENIDAILDWRIKCRHEESIHTSEAIAINYRGVHNGFSEKTYI